MIRRFGLLFVTALILGVAFQPSAPATGASTIQVRDQRVTNRFPDGVEFTIVFESDVEIKDVRLRFHVLPDSPVTSVKAGCTSATLTTCNVLYGNSQSTLLLPGVEIAYAWQIEDASGEQIRTDEGVYFFQDDRYRWEEMTEGILTAYYYSGETDRVRTVLNAGLETVDRFSALLGTTIETPIKLWVYETAAEMQPAIIGSDSTVATTLGEVFYSSVATVSLDSGQALDIVRHELTHIVMRSVEGGGINKFPAWVDEGTAVYAQARLLPGFEQALATAIRSNNVAPFDALISNSLGSTQTALFYSQAWAMVKYLVDTYGEDNYRAFIVALRDNTLDGALKAVYGFDSDGFEAEWRTSVGLPPLAAAPTPRATPTQRPQAATNNSGQSEPSQPNGAAADDGSGTNLAPIIAAITVVLVATILGAGVYIAKKTGSGS